MDLKPGQSEPFSGVKCLETVRSSHDQRGDLNMLFLESTWTMKLSILGIVTVQFRSVQHILVLGEQPATPFPYRKTETLLTKSLLHFLSLAAGATIPLSVICSNLTFYVESCKMFRDSCRLYCCMV